VLAPVQRAPHAEPTANNPLALRFYSKSLGRDRPLPRRPDPRDGFAATTAITKLTGPFGQYRAPFVAAGAIGNPSGSRGVISPGGALCDGQSRSPWPFYPACS